MVTGWDVHLSDKSDSAEENYGAGATSDESLFTQQKILREIPSTETLKRSLHSYT
jgi:hypothetical protein